MSDIDEKVDVGGFLKKAKLEMMITQSRDRGEMAKGLEPYWEIYQKSSPQPTAAPNDEFYQWMMDLIYAPREEKPMYGLGQTLKNIRAQGLYPGRNPQGENAGEIFTNAINRMTD